MLKSILFQIAITCKYKLMYTLVPIWISKFKFKSVLEWWKIMENILTCINTRLTSSQQTSLPTTNFWSYISKDLQSKYKSPKFSMSRMTWPLHHQQTNDHFIPTHDWTLLYLYRHSFVPNEMECMNLPKICGRQPHKSMSIYHPVYNHRCVDDTYPTDCVL